MPYVTVAGARAHYVHRRPVPADRPPLVFVHGAGGTHQHWLYQVRDLPNSQTYALDLPGHGGSEGTGKDSIAGYGDWLVAFLDAIGEEQAIVVGHSMGGAIALDLALRHGSRVAGLGLVGTGARLRVMPAIFEGIRQDPKAAVKLICDFAFGPETPQEMVRLGRRQMEAISPDVFYGDFLACDAFNVMDQLAEIAAPALVLCGTQDQLTPSKYSIYLRDHIAHAALHLIEGAGHMVMVERAKAVAEAISAFAADL